MFKHKHLSIFFRQRADGFKYLLVLLFLFYVLKEPVGLLVTLSISHFISQQDGPLSFLLAVAQGLSLGDDGQPRAEPLGLTQGVDFVYDAKADVLQDVIDIVRSVYDTADERPEPGPVPREQELECLFIALPGRTNQCRFVLPTLRPHIAS
jgi:hypothetical protein